MYLVVYISVAYDTVRWETKERVVIQWITFVFVISLAVDEMRQVCIPIFVCFLYDLYQREVINNCK